MNKKCSLKKKIKTTKNHIPMTVIEKAIKNQRVTKTLARTRYLQAREDKTLICFIILFKIVQHSKMLKIYHVNGYMEKGKILLKMQE